MMKRAEYDGKLLTIQEFRSYVGADYHLRGIYPRCPDCGAMVTIRADEVLPYDPESCFPRAGKAVTTHFAHFPNQADPDCRYVNPNHDQRYSAFSSHLEKDAVKQSVARRHFVGTDGGLTYNAYWAGSVMARMLGTNLREDYNYFRNPTLLLQKGLIPPASSKLWRRAAPSWARPFMWLLFHDFPIIRDNGRMYEIQFRAEVPEGSILDAKGRWHGLPASVVKVFKRSGDDFIDKRTGESIRYLVTQESAIKLEAEAFHWGEKVRPFGHLPIADWRKRSFWPKTSP